MLLCIALLQSARVITYITTDEPCEIGSVAAASDVAKVSSDDEDVLVKPFTMHAKVYAVV
jgi:hypothetical protein